MPIWAALLAVLLVSPSLRVGWQLDDYFHRWLLDSHFGYDGDRSPLDIFRFLSGDPAEAREWMERGSLPWWTDPDLKAAFWRPATALTHWVDYQLWPNSAVPMHVHSILWFGALVIVVGRIYRRLLPVAWVAGLAVVLFALDDAHGNTVGWLASRSGIVAGVFGFAALFCFDRGRRDGSKFGLLAGPVLFGLSLLAKESAVAVMAYLVAYAVFIDGGSARSRVLSLAPYVLVAAVWRLTWVTLGYGVDHMDLYTDPLSEPIRYAGLFWIRAPLLLLGQWGVPPADTFVVLPGEGAQVLWIVAVAVVPVLGLLLAPLLRQSREARFFCAGMLLSLLPAVATVPSDRLLLFAGFGAMGLLARLFQRAGAQGAESRSGGIRRWAFRVALAILAIIHLPVALLLLPLRAGHPLGTDDMQKRLYIRTSFDASDVDRDLIVVNAPSFLHAAYLGPMRVAADEPAPRRLRILATGSGEVDVYRTNERSLAVTPADGYMRALFDDLYRSSSDALAEGDSCYVGGMVARVMAVEEDGYPARVQFEFDRPLESDSLKWLAYVNGTFVPFDPPAVGYRDTIAASDPIFSW